MKFVALLLGINVGGNRKVPMGDLRKLFEKLKFTNVKTLLNSGNVVFESSESNKENLREKIEKALMSTCGFEVFVIVLSHKEIQKLVDEDPFKNIKITPNTRLYVTFLSEKPTTNLKISYESPKQDFKIIRVTDNAVISVLELSEKDKTTDAMKVLNKICGKKITTRNWNTVKKIAAL